MDKQKIARELVEMAKELTAGERMTAKAEIITNNFTTFTHLTWFVPGKANIDDLVQLKKRIANFERRVKKMANMMGLEVRSMYGDGQGLHADSEYGKVTDSFEKDAERAGFKFMYKDLRR